MKERRGERGGRTEKRGVMMREGSWVCERARERRGRREEGREREGDENRNERIGRDEKRRGERRGEEKRRLLLQLERKQLAEL